MPPYRKGGDLSARDAVLYIALYYAGCKTDVKSFKDLDKDRNALIVWNNKKTIKRRISRGWPRDPNGKSITAENSCFGKMASNGYQFWGATLWDFFWVYRFPDVKSLVTISTGSKLLNWMIKNKETEYAPSKIFWAQQEAEPRQISPYPISEIIENQEMRIRLGLCGKSMPLNAWGEEDQDPTHESLTANGIPRAESPWPLIPFSYDAPNLEHYIPRHRLPRKLIVHDPWDVLHRVERSPKMPRDWSSTKDVTYVYNMTLSPFFEKRIEEEVKARKLKEEQQDSRLGDVCAVDSLLERRDGFLLYPSTITSGQTKPPVFVTYSDAPEPKPIETAHLYLSPDKFIGAGNHSLVIQAEWEVPRSLLVPDVLCQECVLEDVKKTLAQLDSCEVEYLEKLGTWEIIDCSVPEVCMDMVNDSFELLCPDSTVTFVFSRGSRKKEWKYKGSVKVVKTNVQWQNADRGPYCSHVLKRMHVDGQEQVRPHPPIARVNLVAKLSTGDDHLEHEANIYKEFPQHIFEHWSGYNVMAPLNQYPVPLGAVVPQYYGYYEPEKETMRYMSPILLMENCGKQIQVESLSEDDKHECASLVYRLHDAGFVHGSLYPRNILHQDGPLDRPRYQRGTGEFTEDGRKHSFRLIDFGRSVKLEDHLNRSMEESVVGKLLKHTWYKNS